MKKFRKIVAASVALVLSFATIPAFAAENGENGEASESTTIPTFSTIAGEVISIEDGQAEGSHSIRIQTENGEADIIYTPNYTFVLGEDVAVGDEIVAHYLSLGIAPLIFPPQYTARLIVNGDFNNVYIDRFYANEGLMGLLSDSGSLLLRIGEHTRVALQDGGYFGYEGDSLAGRLLVVEYDISTRSYPAIAIPNQIIVLFEQAVHPIGQVEIDEPYHEDDDYEINWVDHGISVEGEFLQGYSWQQIGDTIYLPFRAVLNLLDLGDNITWSTANHSITFEAEAGTISFIIGADFANINGTETNFSYPAVLLGGNTTWVPLQFFREVLNLNAYMHAGQVFIHSGEIME